MLSTIPASVQEQSRKFSIKVVNKTAASAAQLQSAFCFIIIHVQLQLPAVRAQTKALYSLFNKLA